MNRKSRAALTVSDLRSTCEDLSQVIGAQRFARLVATFKPEDTRGVPAYLMLRAQAHPFAIEWHALMQEVTESEKLGVFSLSQKSYFLIDHLVRLRGIKNMPGIERILRRLEDVNQYYSAMFEILILCLYYEQGATIEIVCESNRPDERSADFVVRCEAGDVFVECKSLEDKARKEERVWEQIESSIIKLLSSNNRSWRVLICAKRPILGRDIQMIVSMASAQIISGSLVSVSAVDGCVKLSFESISSLPDKWDVGGVEVIARRTERGRVEAEQMNSAGLIFRRKAVLVETIPFVSRDETKRILDDVEDAHGQVPEGKCGVVHIEIPFRESSRLLDVADSAFQRTFGLLRKRSRINAAVLSARSLIMGIKEGENPIIDYHVVIPNMQAAEKFPQDFKILGWSESGAEIRRFGVVSTLRWWVRLLRSGLLWKYRKIPRRISRHSDLSVISINNEGMIFFEFGINRPLSEQRGRSLVNYCSRDGLHQIRIWQSFKNHFRVDVVDPSFGRRVFRSELNDLSVAARHRLALGWSAKGIGVAVDGKSLEQVTIV